MADTQFGNLMDLINTSEVQVPEPDTFGNLSDLISQEAASSNLSEISSVVVPTSKGTYDPISIVKEYNRPLVKEDFLKDERLQELVISNLETRFRPQNAGFEAVRRGASALGGAAIGGLSRDYRNMPFEDVFETWQNYQRSFAGGQSVTTANELAFSSVQDSETLRKLGTGYYLFDNMDNIFTGEGSWSEMADGVWDYTKAAVADPATVASLGIGKALSATATRAGSVAARNVAISALKENLKRGVSSSVAKQAIGKAAAAAPYMAPELVFNVGADIAYQTVKLRTGAQEEYSMAQTGIAAAATMALPAIVGGVQLMGAARKSDLLKDTVVGYQQLDDAMLRPGSDEAWRQVKNVVDAGKIKAETGSQFSNLNIEKVLTWEEAKVSAKEVINKKGERLTDEELMNAFESYFWFGAKDTSKPKSLKNLFSKKEAKQQGGFFNTLKDAGFVVHADMIKDNKISGVYGQAIKEFLDDATVEAAIKSFETKTGRKLNLDYTAEGLSAHFISRASESGRALGIKSRLAALEKSGLTGEQLARAATGGIDVDDPKWNQFALSTYKRLITSHLSTTGANVKGFAQMVTLNTAADFVSSAVYATQWAAAKGVGDTNKAAALGNKAWGSLMSPLRRGAAVLSPDLNFEYSMKILEANPEIIKKLYREVGAGGGEREAAETFGLAGNVVAEGIDKVTSGVQGLTLVRLQDELSKTWAFGANVDTYIMKEYGMTPTKFFAQENLATVLASPKYQNVLEKAARRTLRETMSVNWSTLPAQGMMREAAKTIETITNKTAIGYVVPFGGFMNSVMATAGDLSGINAVRRLASDIGGKKVDIADSDFGELMGKAAVGWTAVAYGIPEALERIQNGLGYNQELSDSGGIKDVRYDWPRPAFRAISQALAHAYVGNKPITNTEELLNTIVNGDLKIDLTLVPDDLKKEIIAQVGPGQAVRDLDDVVRGLSKTFEVAAEGDYEEALGLVLAGTLGRVIQGATRPLDPINTVVGLARGGNMNPDLKQGPEFYSQAFKYMNQLFPDLSKVDELPRVADPLKGRAQGTDVGKQIGGSRTNTYPGIAESMFQSAGIPSWAAVRWGGPAEVKNYMDSVAAPFFEAESIKALKDNPDYFTLSTDRKQEIVSRIQERTKSKVKKFMETKGTPRTMDYVRQISEADKTKVRKVKEFLGLEGEIEDIAKQPNGWESLMMIKRLLDGYDDIFYGDLK
jgi:hypothetical protein